VAGTPHIHGQLAAHLVEEAHLDLLKNEGGKPGTEELRVVNYDRSPTYVPATPEYVLAVLRDQHRQDCSIEYDAKPQLELTFDTTIAEWRFWCDLVDWRRLGRALDTEWKLGLPDASWRAVLEPEGSRTLGDVCSFIAQTAVMPSIEPLSILGLKCLTAGAFLAIRSTLQESGVNVDSVAPSTPLGPIARRHPGVFIGPIAKFAPNALPDVKISRPLYEFSFWVLIFGFVVGLAGSFISPILTGGGDVLAGLGWIGGWISTRFLLPSRVTIGDLRTFGDLARLVAEGARRWRSECGGFSVDGQR
jgi:hypothetical protein